VHNFNYTGPSMFPTLKAGDYLEVIPYGDSRIRIGDVVVFRSPEKERYVVHRVISVSSAGVRTRGDNNNEIDPWVLGPDHITGRVISAQRRRRNIKIYGGAPGRILTPIRCRIKRINLTISRILHPVYHWLARLGIFRKILTRRFRTQILCFQRPDGIEMQLLMGQWIIGRRLPGKVEWQIRRPFRLFVSEASLPRSESHPSS